MIQLLSRGFLHELTSDGLLRFTKTVRLESTHEHDLRGLVIRVFMPNLATPRRRSQMIERVLAVRVVLAFKHLRTWLVQLIIEADRTLNLHRGITELDLALWWLSTALSLRETCDLT